MNDMIRKEIKKKRKMVDEFLKYVNTQKSLLYLLNYINMNLNECHIRHAQIKFTKKVLEHYIC